MTTILSILLVISILVAVGLAILLKNVMSSSKCTIGWLQEQIDSLRANAAKDQAIFESYLDASKQLVARIKDGVHFSTGHSHETDALEDLTIGLFKARSAFDIRIPCPGNFARVGIKIDEDKPVTIADVLHYALEIDLRAHKIERNVEKSVRLCLLHTDQDRIKWFVETFSRISRFYPDKDELLIKDIRTFLDFWESSGSADYGSRNIKDFLNGNNTEAQAAS